MIKANFNAYDNYVTDSLYQWDLNQVLSVYGLNLAVAPEIHFSNANMDKAIVRQSTMVNHVVNVDIPNSLLQDPLAIEAYIGIYENDTFKVIEKVLIPVIPKARPADYRIENSDEEIYSFESLKNSIANMITRNEFISANNTMMVRLDNIVANNNDTEGNSELVDMRLGADGKTYGSAGEAVRKQILDVKKQIDFYKSTPISDDFTGYRIMTAGTVQPFDGYKVTYPVYVGDCDRVAISNYLANNSYISTYAFYNVPDVNNVTIDDLVSGILVSNETLITEAHIYDESVTSLFELEKPADANVIILCYGESNERPIVYKDVESRLYHMADLNVNPFTGLKMCTMGDSLTAHGTWQSSIISRLGLKSYQNCGISGTTIAGSSKNAFWTDERVNSIDEDADFIVVMGGTNDAYNGTPIGDISLDNNDVSTICGALNVLLSKLYYRYVYSDGEYESVNYSNIDRYSGKYVPVYLCTPLMSLTIDTSEVARAIREIAKLWAIPVIDTRVESGLNRVIMSRPTYSGDGIHLTSNAGVILGEYIASRLIAYHQYAI